jgi:hypothetical protein
MHKLLIKIIRLTTSCCKQKCSPRTFLLIPNLKIYFPIIQNHSIDFPNVSATICLDWQSISWDVKVAGGLCCNCPKYINVYLGLIRIITNSFIECVDFHVIIQEILILKSSICVIYSTDSWTIPATKVWMGDTKGLQLVLGRGVTGVTFQSNLLS